MPTRATNRRASGQYFFTKVLAFFLLTWYRFYFADERQDDGGPTIPVDGPAAAEAYIELAEGKEQRPWQYTFKGKGYVDFKGL